MLRTIELDSWSDFEKIIQGQLLEETQEMRAGPLFFRGHSDATWKLETTLERYIGPNQEIDNYYKDILRIQSQIETFTDRNWDLPSAQDYVASLTNDIILNTEPIDAYIQYLRHFGYPSPLLDWTYSPFVAAYFAFRDVTNKAISIAIYELLAAGDMGTGGSPENTHIRPIYASSRKNKRHYLQQSVYTICLRKINGHTYYASHEDPHVIGEDGGEYGGEPITKYILPAGERVTALHSLGSYNINAYSLFGTEESLLETLLLRDYKRREISKNINRNWGGL
jgi:hypothetical protein